jgi:hypothetical protein
MAYPGFRKPAGRDWGLPAKMLDIAAVQIF